ncbi:hypothetical protein [Paenibacillus cremeus]|uniref:Uncharacterized protein n=1 Tax=Paenibacillus cremeus TaxID=2163881 RepID=A0A559K4C7_9BACL|nr:hypothetical protein [Paenibacillus cremeus]TVY06981.1 hypothetical protein FPZ49_26465 [Paenibacillus cremeus]
MDPKDNELQKELEGGPFGPQDGFSEHLKRRIEQRIDEESQKPRKPRVAWLASVSAALVMASAVIVFSHWQSLMDGPLAFDTAASSTEAPEGHPLLHGTVQQQPSFRAALLLGLRTDQPGPQPGAEYSTYRTLLIAPQDGGLGKTAEGAGILMPYKMNFWSIVTESHESAGEETRTLAASMAKAPSASAPAAPGLSSPAVPQAKPVKASEKLLFAGNRYLTVAQKTNEGSPHEYVWVKEVEQLTSREQLSDPPLREPHVSLRSLFGDAVASPAMKPLQVRLPGEPPSATRDQAGESWAIVRKQGHWAAQAADYTDGSRYELKDLSLTLPASVVAHDRLAASWADIKRVLPSALDAFSSPTEDMVAIVSERDIAVYPFHGGQLASSAPLVTIALNRSETVVMAQWALDNYVDEWKRRVKGLLEEK